MERRNKVVKRERKQNDRATKYCIMQAKKPFVNPFPQSILTIFFQHEDHQR